MHNHYFTEILHILRKNRVSDSKIRFALLQKNWTKTRSLALLLQSAPLTASSKRKPQLVDISKLDLNRKIKKFSYSFICGKGYSPPFGGRIAFCLQSELPQRGSPLGRISSENKKKLRRKPCAHSRVFFQYAACFPLKPLSLRNVGVTKGVLTARTAESPECGRRCPESRTRGTRNA